MKALKMSSLGLLLSAVSLSGTIVIQATYGASSALAANNQTECSDLKGNEKFLLGEMEKAINKINDAVRNNDTRGKKEALRDYRDAKSNFFRCKSGLSSTSISQG